MAGKNFFSPGLTGPAVVGESLAGAPTTTQITTIATTAAGVLNSNSLLYVQVSRFVLSADDVAGQNGQDFPAIPAVAGRIVAFQGMTSYSNMTLLTFQQNLSMRYAGSAVDLNTAAVLAVAGGFRKTEYVPVQTGITVDPTGLALNFRLSSLSASRSGTGAVILVYWMLI